MNTEITHYTLHSLPTHLALAGNPEALEELLTDFIFLDEKLETQPIQALLTDYTLTEHLNYPLQTQEAFRLIREALRLSAHIITDDPTQLAGQLYGRLLGFDDEIIGQLLRSVEYPSIRGVRLYPYTPSLTPPSGALHHTLNCHHRLVTSMLYLETQHYLVTASEDGTIRLWDLVQGTSVPYTVQNGTPIVCLALFPDQTRIAFVSEDETLQIWDITTNERWVLCDNTGMAKSVVVLPDGLHLAFGETVAPYRVRVWNVETNFEVMALTGHTTSISISGLNCFKNGDILSAAENGDINIWNLETRTLRRQQKTNRRIRSVAINADETLIRMAGDGGVSTWELESDLVNQESEELYTLPFGAVAVANGDQLFVAAGIDGSLFVWNGTHDAEPIIIPGNANTISSLLITPDLQWLVAGDENGQVKVWDLMHLDELPPLHGHRSQAHRVLIAPNAMIGVSTGGMWYDIKSMYNLKLWNFEQGWLQQTIPAHRDAVTDFEFSADSRWLVSVSHDKTAKIWDVSDPTKPLILLHHQSQLSAVALIPPNLIVTGAGTTYSSEHNELTVWSLNGEYHFSMAGHTGRVNDIVVVGDSSHVLSASGDGTLRLWDMNTRQTVSQAHSRAGSIQKVLIDSALTRAVSMSAKESVEIWAMPTLDFVGELQGHTRKLVDILIVENTVVTIAEDHILCLWDLYTCQHLYEFRNDSYFTSLTLMPVPHQFLYTSGDSTVTLWDIQRKETIARFVGESPMLSCAVSQTGTRLIVGEISGGIHLLEITGHTFLPSP